ncbi:MAG: ferritin family protein [candidate division WOR-3 bacterium]
MSTSDGGTVTWNPDPILDGLKEAMLAEQTGIQFYTTAAEKTVDAQGRQVFEQLADEERQHLEYLQRQFRHILAGEQFEPLTLASKVDAAQTSPIFSPALRHRLKEAHWEMTALAVGLQLELAAIQRYRSLAQTTDRPDVRTFFETLVRWEEGHAAALKKQQEALKEAYWESARFAPF